MNARGKVSPTANGEAVHRLGVIVWGRFSVAHRIVEGSDELMEGL